jgi:glutathione S-transferase
VPTLEEDDGFLLWESNAIVRYLAGKYGAGTLDPRDPKACASASRWMDWQLSVCGPAIHGLFWGLVRTPPEKRDHAQIDASRDKTTAAMMILDAQLGHTRFVAGEAFSMGDIPVGLITYRFRRLAPERSGLGNLERWYGELAERPPFKEHVLAIPFV